MNYDLCTSKIKWFIWKNVAKHCVGDISKSILFVTLLPLKKSYPYLTHTKQPPKRITYNFYCRKCVIQRNCKNRTVAGKFKCEYNSTTIFLQTLSMLFGLKDLKTAMSWFKMWFVKKYWIKYCFFSLYLLLLLYSTNLMEAIEKPGNGTAWHTHKAYKYVSLGT